MKHPEEATLHLHIDGELPTAERWGVEAHLRECGECVRRADEIRELVARMSGLDAEIEPPADLWRGIADRIAHDADAAGAQLTIIRRRRKVYLGAGWVAAIAATLALGIGLGRMAPGPAPDQFANAPAELPGATAAAPAAPPSAEETVAVLATTHEAPAFDSAISELETVLEEASDQLRPETVATIEENLAIIDQAIAEAQEALLADPANEQLHQHIATNKQTKLRLLRTLTTTVTADI